MIFTAFLFSLHCVAASLTYDLYASLLAPDED